MSEYSHTVRSGLPKGTIELLEFQGRDTEDVTLFLRNVTRVAFVQGHHQDHQWLTSYTETCLAGPALRWFSQLDEEVLASWKTLRAAFLTRFGAREPTTSVSPTPRAQTPIPTRHVDQPLSTPTHPSKTRGGRKTLLLGDSGVGKSSLLARVLGHGWTADAIPTNGVHYETWSYRSEDTHKQRHFWDASGAARFKTLITGYYEDVHSIWLIYDITSQSSFDSIWDWHVGIKRAAPRDVKTRLVANKCDLHERRVVTTKQGRNLAEELGVTYWELSSKTNEGVQSFWGLEPCYRSSP